MSFPYNKSVEIRVLSIICSVFTKVGRGNKHPLMAFGCTRVDEERYAALHAPCTFSLSLRFNYLNTCNYKKSSGNYAKTSLFHILKTAGIKRDEAAANLLLN